MLAALAESSKSPEARVCQAAFRELRGELAEILLETLESMDLRYPEPTKSEIQELQAARRALSEEGV